MGMAHDSVEGIFACGFPGGFRGEMQRLPNRSQRRWSVKPLRSPQLLCYGANAYREKTTQTCDASALIVPTRSGEPPRFGRPGRVYWPEMFSG